MPNESISRESLINLDTSFLEVSKSVGDLCKQMSMANIKIPRLEPSTDVFDFLAEFEMATTTLSEDQKLALLAKAFPPGRYRAWYENDLLPRINATASWKIVRRHIIDRFSDTEDRDRHFMRLRELKFDQEDDKKLLDFVEDILFSYRKAFPDSTNAETMIKFVKATIPASLKTTLNLIPDYSNAVTIEAFKKAVKQYDMSRGGSAKLKAAKRSEALDMAPLMRAIASTILKEGENGAIVAALKSVEGTRRPSFSKENRGYSPRRTEHSNHGYSNRKPSPNYRDARPSSPRAQQQQDSYNQYQKANVCNPAQPNADESDVQNCMAFNSEEYFARFKKPPYPCPCGGWHWERHCIKHLN